MFYFLLSKLSTKEDLVDWWLCPEERYVDFYNFLSDATISGKFRVIGHPENSRQELRVSSHYVARITCKGIYTQDFKFFPFKTANTMYLRFLIEANKINTVLAFNWKLEENHLLATLQNEHIIVQNSMIDFIPDNSDILITGYSEELNAKIVLSSFSERNKTSLLEVPLFSTTNNTIEELPKITDLFHRKNRLSIPVKIRNGQ